MGLTVVDAAKLMQWGKSTLQRLERGQSEKVRVVDVKELCQIYGFDEEKTAGLVGLAQQAAVKSWWHEFGELIPENFSIYMGLESGARTLTTYQPDLVPGLLQTPSYARALVRKAYPDVTETDLEGRVQLRQRRQTLIKRPTQPAGFHVVLNESVLRRQVGDPRTMAEQLRSLADLSTRPNITVQVLPFSEGSPTGEQVSPFVILDFARDAPQGPVEPTVVYVEGFTGDFYSEKDHIVGRYMTAWEWIRRGALDDTQTRSLLRQVAKEYGSS